MIYKRVESFSKIRAYLYVILSLPKTDQREFNIFILLYFSKNLFQDKTVIPIHR